MARAGPSGKLQTKYEGPCTITNQVNEVTYRVGLLEHSRASRAFHVSALKPVVEGPLLEEGSPLRAPPPPLEIGEGEKLPYSSSHLIIKPFLSRDTPGRDLITPARITTSEAKGYLLKEQKHGWERTPLEVYAMRGQSHFGGTMGTYIILSKWF
ncbi:hypothetical protein P4O66_000394 [Electrophorus voltai]|uniref:Tf2-1-like SH3-like domain-containing protein n=1 Tax=Electrophorus voltai TaxID=2609070 RepID=A0AAD8ZIH7_9TELE|nr:hypothetical protein P4O66_000394 [Electrophorus voltai]